MSAIRINPFPDCCGIKVISGFGKTNMTLVHNNERISETKAQVQKLVAEYSKGFYSVGLILVALNNDQVPLFHDDLIEEKFRVCQETFYHPGHGKYITLYSKVLFEDETYKTSIAAFELSLKNDPSEFKKKFEEGIQISKPVVPGRRKSKQ